MVPVLLAYRTNKSDEKWVSHWKTEQALGIEAATLAYLGKKDKDKIAALGPCAACFIFFVFGVRRKSRMKRTGRTLLTTSCPFFSCPVTKWIKDTRTHTQITNSLFIPIRPRHPTTNSIFVRAKASVPPGHWKVPANLKKALDEAENKLGIKEVPFISIFNNRIHSIQYTYPT